MEETGTVGSPGEVMKIRRLGCSRAASLEGHATAKSGVYAPLVVIGGESIQFTMEVEQRVMIGTEALGKWLTVRSEPD